MWSLPSPGALISGDPYCRLKICDFTQAWSVKIPMFPTSSYLLNTQPIVSISRRILLGKATLTYQPPIWLDLDESCLSEAWLNWLTCLAICICSHSTKARRAKVWTCRKGPTRIVKVFSHSAGAGRWICLLLDLVSAYGDCNEIHPHKNPKAQEVSLNISINTVLASRISIEILILSDTTR